MALRIRVAVLVGLLASLAQPALAQSFLQSMFGYGSQAPRSPYRAPYGSPYQPGWGGDEGQRLDRGGTYRTLCVRLCDGFYFPISSARPAAASPATPMPAAPAAAPRRACSIIPTSAATSTAWSI